MFVYLCFVCILVLKIFYYHNFPLLVEDVTQAEQQVRVLHRRVTKDNTKDNVNYLLRSIK